MSSFEETIERACTNGEIPGCVLQAVNRDETFKYGNSFGKRSVREGADQSPLRLDTVMWIASCTKLMTSICAMQCVERGLLSLDAPVYSVLPELKDVPVIKSYEATGEPIMSPHQRPITLRLLLTHSSGMSYEDPHPKLIAWAKWTGRKIIKRGKVEERHLTPLVFEPGESWCYGPSIDWVGKMVERVNGNISLEDYMKENLWKPLGVRDMTFFLHQRPDMEARLADMSKRDQDNSQKVKRSNVLGIDFLAARGEKVEECLGGGGVFATPEEYLKILRGVLDTDTDEKLLKKTTMKEFFKPQLLPGAKAALNAMVKAPEVNNAFGGMPVELVRNWGLGGLLTEDALEGGRRKMTMTWGGLPNLIWFIDRESGLCGLYAGQLVPPGDAKCAELNRLFEMTMYERCLGPLAKL